MTHAAASSQLGRRELIAGAGAAALAALFVGPARGALDLLPLIGDSVDQFSRSPIVAKIGETFKVASGTAKGAVLELTEIVELPAFAEIGDIENQFIVRFVGPGAPMLAQDTYEFATKSFGDLPLFVTPVSDPGATNVVYEAIVNRYVPDTTSQGGRP
jgi:hypothetical protein